MASKTGSEAVRALDHPIIFTLLVTMVVIFWMGAFTWIFKAANLPGAAAAVQHP